MNNAVLNKLIRDEMRFERAYDYTTLYAIYNILMREDGRIEFKPMKYKTFKNLLSNWASVESGWLVKVGEGKSARFSKRHPPTYLDRLSNWVNTLIERVKK